jgi:hypothetical protein
MLLNTLYCVKYDYRASKHCICSQKHIQVCMRILCFCVIGNNIENIYKLVIFPSTKLYQCCFIVYMLTIGVRGRQRERHEKNGEVSRHTFVIFGCEGIVSNIVFKTYSTYWLETRLGLKCGKMINLRGSFQRFCTLYVFTLKMNLFYKIHLQTFNVISIVLYHSGPTFGQVLCSCLDAFVVDASDYSGHLIRHLLNVSEAFPAEWFLQFWEQVVWWAHVRTVRRVGKHLPSILFQNFRYCTWGMRPHEIWFQSVSSSISRLRFAEQGPRSLPLHTYCSLLKFGSQLSRKSERLHHPTGHASAVCRTFEMTCVWNV